MVVGGVTVGRGAVIGAAAVVDRDVPDYGIVVGNPSRLVGFAYPPRRPEPHLALAKGRSSTAGNGTYSRDGSGGRGGRRAP